MHRLVLLHEIYGVTDASKLKAMINLRTYSSPGCNAQRLKTWLRVKTVIYSLKSVMLMQVSPDLDDLY